MQSAHMCRYAQGIFAIKQHSVDTAQASATLPFATGLNITTFRDHILLKSSSPFWF